MDRRSFLKLFGVGAAAAAVAPDVAEAQPAEMGPGLYHDNAALEQQRANMPEPLMPYWAEGDGELRRIMREKLANHNASFDLVRSWHRNTTGK